MPASLPCCARVQNSLPCRARVQAIAASQPRLRGKTLFVPSSNDRFSLLDCLLSPSCQLATAAYCCCAMSCARAMLWCHGLMLAEESVLASLLLLLLPSTAVCSGCSGCTAFANLLLLLLLLLFSSTAVCGGCSGCIASLGLVLVVAVSEPRCICCGPVAVVKLRAGMRAPQRGLMLAQERLLAACSLQRLPCQSTQTDRQTVRQTAG